MSVFSVPTETASPADAERWNFAHSVTVQVDRTHFWHVVRNERILKTLESNVPDLRNKRYLEIGCGVGNVIGFLHEHGLKSCTGWDINDEALKLCQNRYPKVTFARRDFLQPVKSVADRYDVVGLFDALEHFEDDQEILIRMQDLVLPGGTAIVTVPAMMSLWSAFDEYYGHFRRYDKNQLTQLLTKAGFTDIRATYMMAPLSLAMLMRKKETRGTDREMNDRLIRDSFLPPAVNGLVKTVLRAEHAVLGQHDFGFGAALIATATRPR